MEITKASGVKERYNREKFCKSLERAGAPKEVVERICGAIEKEMKPGMSTSELSRKASFYLRKENPFFAARYNLKRGIMELGPAGFLFEQYVAAILKEYGYEIKTNQIMRGMCVDHEIDVVANKGNEHFFLELKYHNVGGIKSDIQTVMYMHARMLDIAEAEEKRERGGAAHYAWLITNTKFTSKAIAYGKCRNIKMTGWHYPKGESLEELIERKALYPVTVLPSITIFTKEQCARAGILFARDLVSLSWHRLSRKLHISPNRAQRIWKEAQSLTRTTS